MRAIAVGDIIQCHDPDELIGMAEALEVLDYETDFAYEHDGQPGYYLVIIGRTA